MSDDVCSGNPGTVSGPLAPLVPASSSNFTLLINWFKYEGNLGITGKVDVTRPGRRSQEELEKRVKDMIEKAAALEKKLVEKERIITERFADNNINGIPEGDDKVGFFGGEVNLPLVAGSSLVAVAVVGVIWPNREVGLNLASEVLRCSAAKPG
ncbi:hypothetical protein CQW23_18217 [Capsicum baccatum]|uniref:Uncharacterized protein n=1 Tax=Capsicum baccatum TaxID=33114 RepID=A0A2G2WG37_CAPBA|nr:hypothetical protein CQW23_18217 [Capsicum baccatum]